MANPNLTHTERIEELIVEGKREEAARLHNEYVAAQAKAAAEGETINLTDLLAAKESLHIDAVERMIAANALGGGAA